MTGWDFSDAPTDQGHSGELIPDGTLAWGIIAVRPHNMDQGMVLKTSKKDAANKYLDLEVTILEGKYARRKVWTMPMLYGHAEMASKGMANIRAILEVHRQITNFSSGEPKYRLQHNGGGNGDIELIELHGMRCAVRISIEKGKDGHDDKNGVRYFLSPNPQSSSHPDFQRLVAGDTEPKAKATAPKPTVGNTAPSWAGPSTGQAPARPTVPASTAAGQWGGPSSGGNAPQAGGKPSWLGAAPQVPRNTDDVPF